MSCLQLREKANQINLWNEMEKLIDCRNLSLSGRSERRTKPLKGGAASQKQTKQFHNSWLGMESQRIVGFAVCLRREGCWLWWFVSLGVMGCCGSQCSAKKEDKPPQQSQPDKEEQLNQQTNLSLSFLCCSRSVELFFVGGYRRHSRYLPQSNSLHQFF